MCGLLLGQIACAVEDCRQEPAPITGGTRDEGAVKAPSAAVQ